MCLIVDANCFSHVFNPKDTKHKEFAPVFQWLFYGHGGGLIYGGDKYRNEVDFTSSRYRPLIVELERKGRLLKVCDSCVNERAAALKESVQDPDFDDEHILALIIVSRCRVLCTDDMRMMRFLKKRSLYPPCVKPPKVYRSKHNADLCQNSANVADICRLRTHTCSKIHHT